MSSAVNRYTGQPADALKLIRCGPANSFARTTITFKNSVHL